MGRLNVVLRCVAFLLKALAALGLLLTTALYGVKDYEKSGLASISTINLKTVFTNIYSVKIESEINYDVESIRQILINHMKNITNDFPLLNPPYPLDQVYPESNSNTALEENEVLFLNALLKRFEIDPPSNFSSSLLSKLPRFQREILAKRVEDVSRAYHLSAKLAVDAANDSLNHIYLPKHILVRPNSCFVAFVNNFLPMESPITNKHFSQNVYPKDYYLGLVYTNVKEINNAVELSSLKSFHYIPNSLSEVMKNYVYKGFSSQKFEELSPIEDPIVAKTKTIVSDLRRKQIAIIFALVFILVSACSLKIANIKCGSNGYCTKVLINIALIIIVIYCFYIPQSWNQMLNNDYKKGPINQVAHVVQYGFGSFILLLTALIMAYM